MVLKYERKFKKIRYHYRINKSTSRTKKALGQVNVVNSKNSRSIKDILFNNFFNLLTLWILIIVVIIIAIKEYNQLFFLLVSFANMAISIFQEIKAKKTLDQVSLLLKTSSQVIEMAKKKL